MFEKIQIFQLAQGMAVHAGRRQALIAQNIANADTPGYLARDLPSFAEAYRASAETGQGTLGGIRPVVRPGAVSPNGNSVSLEHEMVAATGVQRDHERALAIYKSALGLLRSVLGRR